MNPHLLDLWEPYTEIVWGSHVYKVYTRVVEEDDFTTRRRFMLEFPDGKKRMLHLTTSKTAAEAYEAAYGPNSHDEIVRQIVADEVVKEIKAAKVHSLPPVSPNVKLVSLDMEPPVIAGVDFAKVESEMMASIYAKGALPGEHVYGKPFFLATPNVLKVKAAMEQHFQEMAMKYAMKPIDPAYFGKVEVVLDSLTGMPKVEPQVTEKGLATLKRYGAVLAG